MKREKTIKITEFGMKPELVGAIIKYITMITAPIHNPHPIPRKPQQVRAKRLTIEDLARTLNDFILETRANFKRIDRIEAILKEHDKKFEQIFDILKRNNLK
jgi:hypothetical protein